MVANLKLKNQSIIPNDSKYLEMQSNINQISDDISKLKEVLHTNQYQTQSQNNISKLNLNDVDNQFTHNETGENSTNGLSGENRD